MIDQLRDQIQKRLDELTAEADRLRDALAALGHRVISSAEQTARSRRPTAGAAGAPTRSPQATATPSAPTPRAATSATRRRTRKPAETATPTPEKAAVTKAAAADGSGPAAGARARRSRPATAPASARAQSGATKGAVLSVLAGGEALTAGEVAQRAGLARPTVSTTLSKLAKSGEVIKAARGYQLASAAAPAGAGESTSATVTAK